MMHLDRDLKHMNGDQTRNAYTERRSSGSHQHTTVRSRMHTGCATAAWLRVCYWLGVLLAGATAAWLRVCYWVCATGRATGCVAVCATGRATGCATGCVVRCVLLASHLPRERNVAMTDPVSKLQVWLINLVSDVIVQQRHLLD